MIIYEALYNSCIYESGYVTISLHKTREGAEKAIAESRAKAKAEHDELYGDGKYKEPFKYDAMKDWHIAETELKD